MRICPDEERRRIEKKNRKRNGKTHVSFACGDLGGLGVKGVVGNKSLGENESLLAVASKPESAVILPSAEKKIHS